MNQGPTKGVKRQVYTIQLENATEFNGGEPQDSKWSEIPTQNILSLTYELSDVKVLFSGFEAYNHIVEYAEILNHRPGKFITRVIVMGRWKDRVYETIYNLQTGKVEQAVEFAGKEYKLGLDRINRSSGRPTTGWRRGKFDPNQMPKMKRI